MKKYKVGQDFLKDEHKEKLVDQYGGYVITKEKYDFVLYGAGKTDLTLICSPEIIVKPVFGSTMDFMKDDWELEDDKIYHCVCISMFKDDKSGEKYLSYFIFNDLQGASNLAAFLYTNLVIQMEIILEKGLK